MTTKTGKGIGNREQEIGKQSEQGRALPEGWRWVKLGDIARLINGDRGRNYPGQKDLVSKGIPFINAGHIQNGAIVSDSMNYISENKFNELGSGKIRVGDIIYCLRGSLGKTAIVKDISKGAIASSLAIIRTSEQVATEYLHFFLASPFGQAEIYKHDNGSAQPNLSAKSVREYKLPLPPIAEQKRIVEVLRDRLAAVDQARQATQAQLEAAQALPAAYLRQIFNSPEAQTWEKKSLGSLALSVQNGIYKKSEFYGHGHPFLRMYNIANDSWNLSFHEMTQVEVDADELKKFSLKKGDILISRVNSFELVGKSGWVCEKAEGNVFENMLIRVRLNDDTNSMFVAQQLRTPDIRKQIEGVAKRAIGQSSINSTDLRNLELFMPSLEKQTELSRSINEKTSQLEEVKSSLQDQLDTINVLPAALLRQAFNGEL